MIQPVLQEPRQEVICNLVQPSYIQRWNFVVGREQGEMKIAGAGQW
jgi:hypothetical protein